MSKITWSVQYVLLGGTGLKKTIFGMRNLFIFQLLAKKERKQRQSLFKKAKELNSSLETTV